MLSKLVFVLINQTLTAERSGKQISSHKCSGFKGKIVPRLVYGYKWETKKTIFLLNMKLKFLSRFKLMFIHCCFLFHAFCRFTSLTAFPECESRRRKCFMRFDIQCWVKLIQTHLTWTSPALNKTDLLWEMYIFFKLLYHSLRVELFSAFSLWLIKMFCKLLVQDHQNIINLMN